MNSAILVAGLIATASISAHAQIVIHGVASAASGFLGEMPRGGSLATARCSGLRGKPGRITAPLSPALPFSLGSDDVPPIRVYVSGALAPLLSIEIPSSDSDYTNITFQVPMERNAITPNDRWSIAYLFIWQEGVTTVEGFGPPGSGPGPKAFGDFGAFFSDEEGYVRAEHADRQPVTIDNPARPGETITAYGADFFMVWPPPPLGVPVPEEPRYVAYPAPGGPLSEFDYHYLFLQEYPELDDRHGSVARTPALRIAFRGLAPGTIGVQQVDFVVPADQPPGDWALFFNRGSCPDGSGQLCEASDAQSSPRVLLPVR